MNMNKFPRGFEHAAERNPLPRWARWLAVALVVGGYALLEAHDAATERAITAAERPITAAERPITAAERPITAAERPKTHVADATP